VAIRVEVRRSFYQDSVVLMQLAATLGARPGVRQAAALMGTPANRELLADAGLAAPGLEAAAPGDLMLAIDADTDETAQSALDAARSFFDEQRRQREASGRIRPRSLESALREMPDANLALISVPGAHAAFEARSALRRGLNVFLFSDNVPIEDEIALKRLAASRGLLCMGPDCGTAYLGGIGLGFANVVPRGRIGLVAASGTGLQAVASHVAALGEGISHGIGVGGRDLSEAVGGLMTRMALGLLAADPATEVIALISKPPAPGVMAELDAIIGALARPVVVCCLGSGAGGPGAGHRADTLEAAATAAVALARGRPVEVPSFTDPADVRARLARAGRPAGRGPGVLGLYTGGTLAHEAHLLLESLLEPPGAGAAHRVIDLGADEFTVGRPHPMIDPSDRAARIRAAGADPAAGVLLVDLMLGRAAHPDPAGPLAAAVRDARSAAAAAGRSLAVVASVVGTEADPQGLRAQKNALERAGIEVLPSNAQACRFAALLIKPELADRLLATAP
jgi:FdrA protein